MKRLTSILLLVLSLSLNLGSGTEALARVSPASQNQALLRSAYSAYQHNQLDRSIHSLEQLITRLSKPPAVLYELLGALYLEKPDCRRGPALLEHGARQYWVAGLYQSALWYLCQQTDQAIQRLSAMIKNNPPNQVALAQAQYMLGTMELEQGQVAEAAPLLADAANTIPNDPVILYNLAIAYESQGQLSEALTTYYKALPYAKEPFSSDIQTQIHRLESQLNSINPPAVPSIH